MNYLIEECFSFLAVQHYIGMAYFEALGGKGEMEYPDGYMGTGVKQQLRWKDFVYKMMMY
jgi:hypothetical protein